MKFSHAMLIATMATAALSAHAMLPTPSDAQAQQANAHAVPNIDTKMNAFLVNTDASGHETLRSLTTADTVVRGDVVEYQGLYTNHDTNRVRSMTVTVDIPEGVELIGAISPSVGKASIDGNHFVNMPIRTKVNAEIQELPLSYYKALRWTVEDLGVGGTASVKYRVRVK